MNYIEKINYYNNLIENEYKYEYLYKIKKYEYKYTKIFHSNYITNLQTLLNKKI